MPGDLDYYIVILLLPVHLYAETGVYVSAEKPRHIEVRKKIMIAIDKKKKKKKKKNRGSFEKREIGLLRTWNAVFPVWYISPGSADPTGKELVDADSPCPG